MTIKSILLLSIALITFSCGYVADPVAPEFLVPDSVKLLTATFENNDTLKVSWEAPDRKKNGDDIIEGQKIDYAIFEASIKDNIKNEKLKSSDFINIATLTSDSIEKTKDSNDKIVFKLNKFDLNDRKALVVVPIFRQPKVDSYQRYDYSIEPGVPGAVVDCIIYYASKNYSNGELRTDVKTELFNSVYGRPAYFGLK